MNPSSAASRLQDHRLRSVVVATTAIAIPRTSRSRSSSNERSGRPITGASTLPGRRVEPIRACTTRAMRGSVMQRWRTESREDFASLCGGLFRRRGRRRRRSSPGRSAGRPRERRSPPQPGTGRPGSRDPRRRGGGIQASSGPGRRGPRPEAFEECPPSSCSATRTT